MITLSTSWKSNQIDNGEDLLQALDKFDITGIELEYRISNVIYRQMQEPLKRSHLNIVSIHNFFPIPPEMTHSAGSGDLFRLSHPDKEERQQAVHWTTKTIEHANDLEAAFVILHCGFVDMNPETDQLYQYLIADQIHSNEAQDFIVRKIEQCEELKPKYIDALLFSLDKLIRVAEKYNIRLGLENRYHYYELPGMDDFSIFFTEFKGGPLGYWHDTGHAQANEILTLIPPEGLLKTYADKLIGVHLHDAVGLDDHLAPGTGEINFEKLQAYINEDTVLVMELKPGTSDSDVSQGICFLQENGLVKTDGEISPPKTPGDD